MAGGSPACAGMDPRLRTASPSATRLPRVRGDGPSTALVRHISKTAPPRARGWTRPREYDPPEGPGSPACAGMDPLSIISAADPARLPRVRGDGPGRPSASRRSASAPPRARGWTLAPNRKGWFPHGSPACAGMDPRSDASQPHRERLPRVRGDGPPCFAIRVAIVEAPPRARGWTPQYAGDAGVKRGSPACAGMDPRCSTPSSTRRRLPRVRGDGPREAHRRGDGRGAPPRARGWTLPFRLRCGLALGSPACAGMDPEASYFFAWYRGLPRVRGDGPPIVGAVTRQSMAPPRARGWTPLWNTRKRLGLGSPACAGMDPPCPR